MKKKYGLFKVLALLLMVVVVLTYFVNGREGSISYLALGDVVLNYLQSFYYFFDTVLFILVVGGFYGFLNKIPAYREMLKRIANRVEGKKRVFVIAVTIIMALLASLTGFEVLLLLFVPMLISIILLLGYDKLVAISATIGGIVVGFIGGVFVTIKDPNSYYSITYTTLDKFVGLDSHFANLLPKILLLVLGIGLLVWHIVSHIKKVCDASVHYDLSNSDVFFVNEDGLYEKTKETQKVMTWPLIFAFGLLFVLMVLGYLPWFDLFGLDIFNDLHAWLLKLKIGDYVIFTDLISSSLSTYGAFGTWGGLGNYMMAMAIVFVFTALLALVYRIKLEDMFDGFIYGIKKMIPAVLIVMLGYTVLVCGYNHGFFETVIAWIGEQFGSNPLVHGFTVLLGSVLHVDLYYATAGVFTPIVSSLNESANLSVYATMFQSLYGLVQIIGPTSVMLLIGLSYLEVPYKTWLNYIWRFVVELLIVILLVAMIVSLL